MNRIERYGVIKMLRKCTNSHSGNRFLISLSTSLNSVMDPLEITPFGSTETVRKSSRSKQSTGAQMGTGKWKKFISKYFLEGQKLANDPNNETIIEKPEPASFEQIFIRKHIKFIGFVAPIVFWHLLWWSMAIKHNLFALYPIRYEMALTMLVGAVVAGMTSAAFTITWMNIALEWRSIIFCSIGGAVGVIVGLEFVDPHMTGAQKKMAFVSIWFSFAMALFLLNMQKKRNTFLRIRAFNWSKMTVLIVTGFAGGVCTSFAGSGVDICSFSTLTLLFHVSEKVATPTSVVLMAVNACVGFYWRHLIMGTVSQLAWEYLAVCVPIVVICAPLGSLIGSHFHRLVLANLIYIMETVALVSGFAIVRPSIALSLLCCAIIIGGFTFFYLLTKLGTYLSTMEHINAQSSGAVMQSDKMTNILSGDLTKADIQ